MDSSLQLGNVTLIFYRVDKKSSKEPFLNRAAAYMTNSDFSHVEMSIGGDLSKAGLMQNVVRIFNDKEGVAVTERTGINPNFLYMNLSCSKESEEAMLKFAKKQVGKPFSMIAMIRSITAWPRTTNEKDWFCAELVAATLQKGGNWSPDNNPATATPESLYRQFQPICAAAANPVVLHRFSGRNNGADTSKTALSDLKVNVLAGKGNVLSGQTSLAQAPQRSNVQNHVNATRLHIPKHVLSSISEVKCLHTSAPPRGYTQVPTDSHEINTANDIREAVRRSGVMQTMQNRAR